MGIDSIDLEKALDAARACLEIEASAIGALKRTIGPEFKECILSILNSPGRVVVTGIGKSANVGQKFVATLNSTGTPALFMHASDAVHGDLGMIQDGDIVFFISKSGNTPEIQVLAPLIISRGNTIVCMTADKNSSLAKQSKIVLHTPVLQEADPNDLAPTASSIAQMALGDALSMALVVAKGFSISDFGKLHPGGNLGRKLFSKVLDLLDEDQVPIVHLKDDIRHVILEISSKRRGATAVIDDQENLVGIITDGDLRRMLGTSPDVLALCAEELMTSGPVSVEAEELLANVLVKMKNKKINQVLITKKGVYCGILHIHDLLREGYI